MKVNYSKIRTLSKVTALCLALQILLSLCLPLTESPAVKKALLTSLVEARSLSASETGTKSNRSQRSPDQGQGAGGGTDRLSAGQVDEVEVADEPREERAGTAGSKAKGSPAEPGEDVEVEAVEEAEEVEEAGEVVELEGTEGPARSPRSGSPSAEDKARAQDILNKIQLNFVRGITARNKMSYQQYKDENKAYLEVGNSSDYPLPSSFPFNTDGDYYYGYYGSIYTNQDHPLLFLTGLDTADLNFLASQTGADQYQLEVSFPGLKFDMDADQDMARNLTNASQKEVTPTEDATSHDRTFSFNFDFQGSSPGYWQFPEDNENLIWDWGGQAAQSTFSGDAFAAFILYYQLVQGSDPTASLPIKFTLKQGSESLAEAQKDIYYRTDSADQIRLADKFTLEEKNNFYNFPDLDFDLGWADGITDPVNLKSDERLFVDLIMQGKVYPKDSARPEYNADQLKLEVEGSLPGAVDQIVDLTGAANPYPNAAGKMVYRVYLKDSFAGTITSDHHDLKFQVKKRDGSEFVFGDQVGKSFQYGQTDTHFYYKLGIEKGGGADKFYPRLEAFSEVRDLAITLGEEGDKKLTLTDSTLADPPVKTFQNMGQVEHDLTLTTPFVIKDDLTLKLYLQGSLGSNYDNYRFSYLNIRLLDRDNQDQVIARADAFYDSGGNDIASFTLSQPIQKGAEHHYKLVYDIVGSSSNLPITDKTTVYGRWSIDGSITLAEGSYKLEDGQPATNPLFSMSLVPQAGDSNTPVNSADPYGFKLVFKNDDPQQAMTIPKGQKASITLDMPESYLGERIAPNVLVDRDHLVKVDGASLEKRYGSTNRTLQLTFNEDKVLQPGEQVEIPLTMFSDNCFDQTIENQGEFQIQASVTDFHFSIGDASVAPGQEQIRSLSSALKQKFVRGGQVEMPESANFVVTQQPRTDLDVGNRIFSQKFKIKYHPDNTTGIHNPGQLAADSLKLQIPKREYSSQAEIPEDSGATIKAASVSVNGQTLSKDAGSSWGDSYDAYTIPGVIAADQELEIEVKYSYENKNYPATQDLPYDFVFYPDYRFDLAQVYRSDPAGYSTEVLYEAFGTYKNSTAQIEPGIITYSNYTGRDSITITDPSAATYYKTGDKATLNVQNLMSLYVNAGNPYNSYFPAGYPYQSQKTRLEFEIPKKYLQDMGGGTYEATLKANNSTKTNIQQEGLSSDRPTSRIVVRDGQEYVQLSYLVWPGSDVGNQLDNGEFDLRSLGYDFSFNLGNCPDNGQVPVKVTYYRYENSLSNTEVKLAENTVNLTYSNQNYSGSSCPSVGTTDLFVEIKDTSDFKADADSNTKHSVKVRFGATGTTADFTDAYVAVKFDATDITGAGLSLIRSSFRAAKDQGGIIENIIPVSLQREGDKTYMVLIFELSRLKGGDDVSTTIAFESAPGAIPTENYQFPVKAEIYASKACPGPVKTAETTVRANHRHLLLSKSFSPNVKEGYEYLAAFGQWEPLPETDLFYLKADTAQPVSYTLDFGSVRYGVGFNLTDPIPYYLDKDRHFRFASFDRINFGRLSTGKWQNYTLVPGSVNSDGIIVYPSGHPKAGQPVEVGPAGQENDNIKKMLEAYPDARAKLIINITADEYSKVAYQSGPMQIFFKFPLMLSTQTVINTVTGTMEIKDPWSDPAAGLSEPKTWDLGKGQANFEVKTKPFVPGVFKNFVGMGRPIGTYSSEFIFDKSGLYRDYVTSSNGKYPYRILDLTENKGNYFYWQAGVTIPKGSKLDPLIISDQLQEGPVDPTRANGLDSRQYFAGFVLPYGGPYNSWPGRLYDGMRVHAYGEGGQKIAEWVVVYDNPYGSYEGVFIFPKDLALRIKKLDFQFAKPIEDGDGYDANFYQDFVPGKDYSFRGGDKIDVTILTAFRDPTQIHYETDSANFAANIFRNRAYFDVTVSPKVEAGPHLSMAYTGSDWDLMALSPVVSSMDLDKKIYTADSLYGQRPIGKNEGSGGKYTFSIQKPEASGVDLFGSNIQAMSIEEAENYIGHADILKKMGINQVWFNQNIYRDGVTVGYDNNLVYIISASENKDPKQPWRNFRLEDELPADFEIDQVLPSKYFVDHAKNWSLVRTGNKITLTAEEFTGSDKPYVFNKNMSTYGALADYDLVYVLGRHGTNKAGAITNQADVAALNPKTGEDYRRGDGYTGSWSPSDQATYNVLEASSRGVRKYVAEVPEDWQPGQPLNYSSTGVYSHSDRDISYKLSIFNYYTANDPNAVPIKESVIYDVFPYVGDTNMIPGTSGAFEPRDSVFANSYTGEKPQITLSGRDVSSDYDCYFYLPAKNGGRNMEPALQQNMPFNQNIVWTAYSAATQAELQTAQAIKIVQKAGKEIPVDERLNIEFRMHVPEIPDSELAQDPQANEKKAWNNLVRQDTTTGIYPAGTSRTVDGQTVDVSGQKIALEGNEVYNTRNFNDGLVKVEKVNSHDETSQIKTSAATFKVYRIVDPAYVPQAGENKITLNYWLPDANGSLVQKSDTVIEMPVVPVKDDGTAITASDIALSDLQNDPEFGTLIKTVDWTSTGSPQYGSSNWIKLPIGRYILEEITPPDGFLKPGKGRFSSFELKESQLNERVKYLQTVANTEKPLFPSTGGYGSAIVIAGGIILILLAVWLLTKRRTGGTSPQGGRPVPLDEQTGGEASASASSGENQPESEELLKAKGQDGQG